MTENGKRIMILHKKGRRKSRMKRKELYAGLLFALPAILGFLIFTLGPMISSFILGLTDYSIVNTPKFIGLQNYINMFSGADPFFYKSLVVTSYFTFLCVPATTIFALCLALLLNTKIKGRIIFRTIFYLPSIIPVVATSMIWLWLFNPDMGMINNILRALGLPTSLWIFSETMVIPSFVIMALWSTGNTIVIFLAGLQSIPSQLYEAAEVDGANYFYKLVHITLPMLSPTIFFNVVMGFIGGFQLFAQPFIMTGGGPNDKSLAYVFYLYREAFRFSKMGSASAIAWVLFFIIVIFTAIIFKTSKSWVYYEVETKK